MNLKNSKKLYAYKIKILNNEYNNLKPICLII